MLARIQNALGISDTTQTRPAGPSDFKKMLERASKTETAEPSGAVVRRLHSLDQLAKRSLSLTPAVIDAQVKLDKLRAAYSDAVEEANAYLEKLKSEFEAAIAEADVALTNARTERRRSQYHLIRQQIETGCFEDVKDLGALAATKEFSDDANA